MPYSVLLVKQDMTRLYRILGYGWLHYLSLCFLLNTAQAQTIEAIPNHSGTGFLVSHDGYVLTANHVVSSCIGPISVHSDTLAIKTRLVAADTSLDIALLKIVPPLTMSHIMYFRPLAQALAIGDSVVVAGFPSNAWTGDIFISFRTDQGKISRLDTVPNFKNRIFMSDAAGTAPVGAPGYSGGPVLDGSGNVIGLISAGTCGNERCIEGFKRVEATAANIRTVEQMAAFDAALRPYTDTTIAIALPALRQFLDTYRVPYMEQPSTTAATTERITEMSEAIINVRCAVSKQNGIGSPMMAPPNP